jgi:hypothetical protein
MRAGSARVRRDACFWRLALRCSGGRAWPFLWAVLVLSWADLATAQWTSRREIKAIHGPLYIGLYVWADLVAAQWTSRNYSVVTGSRSIYPLRDGSPGVQLPPALRPEAVGAGPGYTFPESQHPNLRFWFTPEALEELNLASGARVTEWRNVANICYLGHSSTECTHEKKSGMKPMADEVLAAPTAEAAPQYIKDAVTLQETVTSAGARRGAGYSHTQTHTHTHTHTQTHAHAHSHAQT